MARGWLLTAAVGLALVLVGQQAQATVITGTATSTFTNDNCSGTNCLNTVVSGTPTVEWGSDSIFQTLHNPSTLTAPSSLPFTGSTNTTLTIGELDWLNNPEALFATDSSFNVNWNLAVAFTSPPGSTGDTQTFALDIANNFFGADQIGNLTLADLSGLNFSIPGVTVSNFQYHVTDGSGAGTSSISCNGTTCTWTNAESNTSKLTITADFTTASVPEPTTLALLGVGLVGLGMARRRRKAA